jgi:hypothetical protein
MKTVLVLLLVSLLFGCASLNNAGTASYVVRPYAAADGSLHCCEVIVNNGKEIAALDARIEAHPGSHYIVELHERGVAAFAGQKIASDVAGNVLNAVPVLP